MRILFCGTGDIAIPVFSAFLDHAGCEVAGLVCQPDKPAGRGGTLTAPAIKPLALARGVPVHQPARIRHAGDLIAGLAPDLMVVMAYGQILPQAILDLPRLGCINLHASLLPRHRGASPVQAAIDAGDTRSGITVMQMDAGLDTGDILHAEAIELASDETGGSLHDRLAALAPRALFAILPEIAAGTVRRVRQDESLATHCGRLTRADGVIAWGRPATVLERRIRAWHPWPGTSTTLPGGGLLKIFPPVTVCQEATGCPLPGTILHAGSDGIRVACGEGSLTLHEVQAEGRRRMPAAAFLPGCPLRPGERLGGGA